MVDAAKILRLRRRFVEWRGEVHAAEEEALIASAMAISTYVDGTTLKSMQKELIAGSKTFLNLGVPHHKRTFGALLYGKLALEEYYLQSPAGERDILQIGLDRLRSVYENPRNHPVTKFHELVANTRIWLAHWALKSSNPTLAKSTLLSIYAMLRIFDIKLSQLSVVEKAILAAFSVDRLKIQNEMHSLMGQIETKIIELERMIDSTLASKVVVQKPVEHTIESYINRQCLGFFMQAHLSLDEKMALTRTELDRVQAEITALIAENARGATIQTQINHALSVLRAINANDKKTFGRQYFESLINSNKESVHNLLSNSSEDEQAEWAERLRLHSSPTKTQRAKNIGLYALSWSTFLGAGVYRKIVPNKLKKMVEEYTPETLDQESKTKLKALALTRLKTLEEALKLSNENKAAIAQRLTNDHHIVKTKMLSATPNELEVILAKNVAIQEAISAFETLSAQILQNRDKLRVIRKLGHKVDSFLAEHDGFLVKLSLFFSRFSNFFKTATAAKVEEVRSIKVSLQKLKTQYEASVARNLKTISEHPNIDNPIKDSILANLSATEDQKNVDSLPPQSPPQNIITAFSQVKTMFNRFVPSAVQHQEQAEVVLLQP